MGTQTVECLIEGGKASAAPPVGSSLGPLGVNIGEVVNKINEKTASFKGMQVPVKISVDEDTKEFEISVGTPPASQLILKEAGVQKGSGNPVTEKVADLKIEQLIKIAKMKEDALLGANLKSKVKEIAGTCDSMGIMVEGKQARESIVDINAGKFDAEIKAEKTELSAEEMKELEEEKKKLAAEIEARRTEFEAQAKAIISDMKGKESHQIKAKLTEAGIPALIIKELVVEEAPKEGGEEAAAAAPEEPAKK